MTNLTTADYAAFASHSYKLSDRELAPKSAGGAGLTEDDFLDEDSDYVDLPAGWEELKIKDPNTGDPRKLNLDEDIWKVLRNGDDTLFKETGFFARVYVNQTAPNPDDWEIVIAIRGSESGNFVVMPHTQPRGLDAYEDWVENNLKFTADGTPPQAMMAWHFTQQVLKIVKDDN